MPIALYQRVPLQRCTTQPPLQNIPSTLVLAHPNIVPTVSTRSVASQRWRRRARRCFNTWPLQRVSFNPFTLPLRSARSIGDVTFASDAAGTRSAHPVHPLRDSRVTGRVWWTQRPRARPSFRLASFPFCRDAAVASRSSRSLNPIPEHGR